MKSSALRYLLILDAAVLFLLGAILILAPRLVLAAFHFRDLPPAVSYLVGLWGCVVATTGFGYVAAASNPIRHIVWIQIGIARGVLECLVGVVYLARGEVTLPQAGFGIILAGLISLAYIALYPGRPLVVPETSARSGTQLP